MTEHRQKCVNCGYTNVTKLIPQAYKTKRSNLMESTQPLQVGERFALLKVLTGRKHVQVPDSIKDGLLFVYHQTFDRKQTKVKHLKMNDISYYKEIAQMINMHHWSIANIKKYTRANGSKARSIHNDFKEMLYITVDDGNNTAVTDMGKKFLERIARNY